MKTKIVICLLFVFVITLLPQISQAQLSVENNYKGCDLNSSFSIKVNGYRGDLENFQKNKSAMKIDSLDFIADSTFGDGQYGVALFCEKTKECITFRWECDKKHSASWRQVKYYMDHPSLCNEVFVTYSRNFSYLGDEYDSKDTTTIIFCLGESGAGGYFKLDPNSSLFINGPYLNETTVSLANKKDIEVIKKRVIDICVVFYEYRQQRGTILDVW